MCKKICTKKIYDIISVDGDIRNNCFGLNINDCTAEKLERTFGLEKEKSNTGLDDGLAFKKEAKEMASIL